MIEMWKQNKPLALQMLYINIASVCGWVFTVFLGIGCVIFASSRDARGFILCSILDIASIVIICLGKRLEKLIGRCPLYAQLIFENNTIDLYMIAEQLEKPVTMVERDLRSLIKKNVLTDIAMDTSTMTVLHLPSNQGEQAVIT